MNKYLKKTIFIPLYYTDFYKLPSKLNNLLNNTKTVLILTYHRILPKSIISKCLSQRSLILSLESFRKQLVLLKKHYSVISMDEYFFLKKNGVKNKKKPYAIITFDDGWADNYIYALDEIYREKLPATIYLTSDFIGTNNLFWPERLFFLLANFSERTVPDQVKLFITKSFRENICKILLDILRQNDFSLKKELTNYLILHLKEYRIEEIHNLLSLLSSNQKFGNYDQLSVDRLLTWEEVKEMHSLGISFGSHTRSHAILTNIPIDIAKEEIVHSKEEIEMKTGVPVLDFSYPNGFYNKQLTKLVQNAGYRSAVTGINSLSNFHTDVFALQRKGNNELRLIDNNGDLNAAMTLLEWSNFIGFFRSLKKNQYH